MQDKKQWDVIVIGGGPAGMMAAGRAGERGRSVLLLEKNKVLGKKLLISGGGRCNLTNNKQSIRTMALQYTGSDQFLMSPFSQFGVRETLDFFNSRGMKTNIEAEGRVFPESNMSQSVLDVLVDYMNSGNVSIKKNTGVTEFSFDKKNKNFVIKTEDDKKLITHSCILATGGTSHPETGSTGDGFVWLERHGHTIVKNDFALVPITIKNDWVKRLAGVTISDVKLTVFQDGKRQDSKKGKLLFTHFGISGPTVLNMSRDIGELLRYGKVTIVLDMFPALDHGMLKANIQSALIKESNRKLKNTLSDFIPTAFVPIILGLTHIDGDTPNHSVRHEERIKLVACVKEMVM
ncbi:aminoacetone oxidase family FAD-binding enzyme, partial [Candidatus Parcubacteria bacterium]